MNVFVAALDWGLGHATRTIPIIRQEISAGNKVIIGAGKNQKPIYREHFANIEMVEMPSSPPRYSKRNSQFCRYLLFVPRFLWLIRKEHILLKTIVEQYQIEKVISDNCYGLYHGQTKNIIITHQLNLKLPRYARPFQRVVDSFIRRKLNHFGECHVPDFEVPNNLSGGLSFPLPKLKCAVKHIGVQTRLSCVEESKLNKYPELIVLISGPENQRTVFENTVVESIAEQKLKLSYLIVRGLPNAATNSIPNSVNHLTAPELKACLKHAKYIVARAGYSTIMDLHFLGKKAFLVPTPGQTEQEYLAEYLSAKERFLSCRQNEFDFGKAIRALSM